MRKLSTHVLDTAHGCPAAGMTLRLLREQDGQATLVAQAITNADGRTDSPLLAGEALIPGVYELHFEAGSYFRARGVPLAEPPFLDRVILRFGIAPGEQGYHVPLLVSPWSWSSYRGS